MTDNTTGKVQIQDFLSPYIGPTEYTPPQSGEGFDNPFQAAGTEVHNLAHGIANTFRGLRSLEALGIGRIGRTIPTVHQALLAGNQAAQGLLQNVPTPFPKTNLSQLLGVPENLKQLESNPASQDKLQWPLQPSDAPVVGQALAQIIKQPINDYLRPTLAGHPEAALTAFARDPFSGITNLAAGGAIAKGLGAGKLARIAKVPQMKAAAIGKLDAALQGQIGKSARAWQAAINANPMLQSNASVEALRGPLPAHLEQSFNAARQTLTKLWDRIPNNVKPAVAAFQAQTDPAAKAIVTASPEAQAFLDAANTAEEGVMSEALKRGFFTDETIDVNRWGGKYMAAVKANKWPAPFLKGRGIVGRLRFEDLKDPLVIEDMKEFARLNKGKPGYHPLVSEQEAQAHFRTPINTPLAGQAGADIGAFKARNYAHVARNAGGYLSLTSGQNTANLGRAFVVRLEQTQRALALYDWAEDFGDVFEKMPQASQRLIARRLDGVIEKAFQAAGMEAPATKLQALVGHYATEAPANFMEALQHRAQQLVDYFTGKSGGIAAGASAAAEKAGIPGIKKIATAQRITSILPDLFYPLYMSVQQAIFLGTHAASGPKAAARCLIAGYLVKNPRIAKLIVPHSVLEESRIFKPNWQNANPRVQKFLDIAAEGLHKLSLYQDSATRSINLFRGTGAAAKMMEEFSNLSPGAQSYVLKGLHQQLNLQKLVINLAKHKRAIEGGYQFKTRLPAQPIQQYLKTAGKKIAYRNRAVKKGMTAYNKITDTLLNKAHTLTPKQMTNLETRQIKLLAAVEKHTNDVAAIKAARTVFMQGKSPIRIKRPWGSGSIVNEYVKSEQRGLQGMKAAEASHTLNKINTHVWDFFGNYQARHGGFFDDLNTSILWLNMKIHAIKLGYRLHTDYAISGNAIDRLAQFAAEQQAIHSEQKELSPWAKSMGVWESDRYTPEGTRALYAPHGWVLMTSPLGDAQNILHGMMPDIAGVEDQHEDLNWLFKAGIMFSGQLPGKDRDMKNPSEYSFGGKQYRPEQLAAAIDQGRFPTPEDDAVSTAWPNIIHQLFQSAVEPFSEKHWSYAKTLNKTASVLLDREHGFKGQEPSDLTIPFTQAQYPKHLDNNPFGEVRPAGEVSLTSLLPGGSKFSSFTTTKSPLEARMKMKEMRGLYRKAIDAYYNLHKGEEQPAVRLKGKGLF